MIKKLIVVGILLTTSVFAEKGAMEALSKNVLKAIPYDFVFGKTTCAEIGKKFKALDSDNDYFGIYNKFTLFCDSEDFPNTLFKLVFYSKKAIRKLKLFDDISKVNSETIDEILTSNGIEYETQTGTGEYNCKWIYLDNDLYLYIRFYQDNASAPYPLESVTVYKESEY